MQENSKIEGAANSFQFVLFCAVCCQVIAYVKRTAGFVSVEGATRTFRSTRALLCAKGAGLMGMYTGKPRLMKPLYRAPIQRQMGRKRTGTGPWTRLRGASRDDRDKTLWPETRRQNRQSP